jgi:hypothetical protein
MKMSENIDPASLPPGEPVACSVSNQAGVYYAQLYVPGHANPMRVALHGVTNDEQAAQALESFARLRSVDVDLIGAL